MTENNPKKGCLLYEDREHIYVEPCTNPRDSLYEESKRRYWQNRRNQAMAHVEVPAGNDCFLCNVIKFLLDAMPTVDSQPSFFVGAWFGATAAVSFLAPEHGLWLAMLYPAAFAFNLISLTWSGK